VNDLWHIQAALGGPALLAVLAGMGMVAGVFAGLFGVGGAFLLNPVMIVLLGMDESIVVGSGLAFIIGTSAAGVSRHIRSRNVEFRSVLSLGVGAVAGAALGSLLHASLRASMGEGPFRTLIQALYVVLLTCTSWLVFRDSPPHVSGRSFLQRLPLPPHVDLPAAGLTGVSVPGLAMLGILIGLTTGMLGIGGGVLFVPLLVLGVGFPAHQAVGTSLGVVMLGSISGAVSHCLEGHVNLWIAMSMLVGSSIGIQIGVAICDRLHAKKLRRYFALVLLLAAVMVVVNLALPKRAKLPAATPPTTTAPAQ
jgi:uncharacterized membrane protein YfcA